MSPPNPSHSVAWILPRVSLILIGYLDSDADEEPHSSSGDCECAVQQKAGRAGAHPLSAGSLCGEGSLRSDVIVFWGCRTRTASRVRRNVWHQPRSIGCCSEDVCRIFGTILSTRGVTHERSIRLGATFSHRLSIALSRCARHLSACVLAASAEPKQTV